MIPGGIGMMEGVLILFVVLVLFGAKKLPEVGEGLGKGIRSFKKSIAGIEDKTDQVIEEKSST
jgi:sec-independent protein translocase protein TatA